MKQPYENVYLGNFIFALGFYAAETKRGLSDKSIQLVQQTPDEEILNDLFINWSGRSFIFEFKRNKKKISTELEKDEKKSINNALNLTENENWLNLSNKAHFLGFGLPSGLGFILYSSIHKDFDKYICLPDLCKAVLSQNTDFGLNHKELVEYLDFIKSVTGTTSEGCGGFILNISEEGDLNMIPFDDVNVLSQSLDMEYENISYSSRMGM